MARNEGEGHAQCFFSITIAFLDELTCTITEEWKYIIMDFFQVFEDAVGGSTDNIFCLRDSNSLEFDSSLAFDILNEVLGLVRVERDASA